MEVVRQRCAGKSRLALQEIFAETKDMNEVITLFLAKLELVKVQEVQASGRKFWKYLFSRRGKSKLAEIEALLFVAEKRTQGHQLAEILSLPPTGVIQSLEKLAEQYEANPDSSLTLLETSRHISWSQSQSLLRFCGPIHGRQSIKVCRGQHWRPCLSLPISSDTRVEIDDIRGVNSSGALAKLLAFELVREDGKKEVIGCQISMCNGLFLRLYGRIILDEAADCRRNGASC